MIRYPLWGALVSLLLWTGSLAAQQRPVSLDTLRVTASSRASVEMATATRAVEVITAEQIRRLPARSVAEVLQWALGVDLMPRSPALLDVAVRGSSFEQVLVLVDGIRMSDAQTGHFDLNLAVPLDQVDRIEILRGPASTLHGVGADAYPLAGVRLGVAGFIRSADHLIDWAKPASTPKAPWQTRNVEDARFHGVETEAGIDELLGVRWTLCGSWLSVRSSEAEGFTSKYALRPLTESVSLVAERGRRLGSPAYLRLDLRTAYQLKGLRFFADLQNASGETYFDITGSAAPGRALFVGIEWRG